MGTDIKVEFEAKRNGKWEPVHNQYAIERNYLFFAWLANQRNEYGVQPIAKHRGLPRDYRYEDGPGEHSQSWLSVDEILNAPDQEITMKGCLAEAEYKKWNGVGKPSADVIYGPELSGRHGYVEVTWTVKIREEFSDFLKTVEALRNEYGEVRMVFGFDS
ncbi:hypothetical protein OLJ77_004259 [Escherichia coli]|nr:hypothetical protein [Salmonella enterica]EKA5221711.1 hypothetical protein [Escherichia coli]